MSKAYELIDKYMHTHAPALRTADEESDMIMCLVNELAALPIVGERLEFEKIDDNLWHWNYGYTTIYEIFRDGIDSFSCSFISNYPDSEDQAPFEVGCANLYLAITACCVHRDKLMNDLGTGGTSPLAESASGGAV